MYNETVFNTTGKQVHRLETLQTDNDGVYCSNECKRYYRDNNIRHQTIVAYDSKSNGSPERLNRTIMQLEGSIRHHANIGPEFWEFSVGMAVYLLNMHPKSSLPNSCTPIEAWSQQKPK